MSILHFSGKFKFNVPYYNNDPSHLEVGFDQQINPLEVQKNIGADPLQYFEFEFLDVFTSKVTYDDGTFSTNYQEDSAIGKKVLLKGLLVDVAPHLERGRLFAGEFRITDILMGKLDVAFQSELVQNIKTEKLGDIQNSSVCYSAFFDSKLYEINNLTNGEAISENSRYLKELEKIKSDIKIHYTVNRFINKTIDSDNSEKVVNEGDVYGYISESIPLQNSDGIRLKERNLVFNPDLEGKDKEEKINDIKLANFEDLVGTYEIQEENKLVVLSFINLIPLVDLEYNTLKGIRYFVKIYYGDKEIEHNGEKDFEIEVNRKSFFVSGGTKVIKFQKTLMIYQN